MAIRRSLSIYRIKETIDGENVNEFEDVLQHSDTIKPYDLTADFDFDARLFVDEPSTSYPSWLTFLEEGFGEIEDINKAISYRAVVVIRIDRNNNKYFAIPFGSGRFLLKPGCFVQDYGLKVALNTIYAEPQVGPFDPARLRSLDIKTVSSNTLHTRLQTNRRANFELFRIDTDRDLLKRITGLPNDTDYWGSRVSGADAVRINPIANFSDLGNILEEVETTYQNGIYQRYFSWIDNIKVVTDPIKKERLQSQLIDLLKSGQIEQFELAPPELVDFDQIAGFRYHPGIDQEYPNLEIADLYTILEEQDRLDTLTVKQLKSLRVIAVDHNGQEINRWNAFNCISGELTTDEGNFLFEEGDLFEVSPDYLEDLNIFISTIPLSDLPLMNSREGLNEGDYNTEASIPQTMLCLDKENVRLENRTTAIEICDILTDHGHYIHVKRDLRSSELSHLFNQGYVSGQLLWAAPEFREAVSNTIKKVETEKFNDFMNRFDHAIPDPFSTQGIEIVYGIIADWNNRAPQDAIPFFSKINLRRVYEDLTQIGYRVSLLTIPIV